MKLPLIASVIASLAVAGCTSEAVKAEKEISRHADPAARNDIISSPSTRQGIHQISVYGYFGSIPARYVYSSPVSDLFIAYDQSKTSKAAVIIDVASFCTRNGFGNVTKVIDTKSEFVPRPGVREIRPAVQIKCKGFTSKTF